MCVKQVSSTSVSKGSAQSSAAAETATPLAATPSRPQPQSAAIKSSPSSSPPLSATLLSVNLAPLLAMPTAAPTGQRHGSRGTGEKQLRERSGDDRDHQQAIFEADVVEIENSEASPLALAADAVVENAARAQDAEDESSRDSMGQCYPKCMTQVDGVEDGRILPGTRAKRSSKQRTNLISMKKAVDSSSNTINNNGDDNECDNSCLDFSAIGRAMGALDLEELASDDIVNGLFEQPPKSIVVDYEEVLEVEQHRPRQGSISDCARDACRPLDSEHAQQNPAEELFSIDPKSAPLTPGRRRSRQDSFGNSSSNNISNNSSVTTPRRGKSVILENAKVVPQDPVSPLTDTDTSEKDVDPRCSSVPKLCLCEVKLHKTRDSCWLVANHEVFDVTGILDVHPGGPRSILRKAGGPDCTQDMKFHTKNARKMLDKCFIGKLQPCGDEPERPDTNCSIM